MAKLKQNINLGLKQQLNLTPQLQHAIKILAMNRLELSQEIQFMLDQNVMLESRQFDEASEHDSEIAENDDAPEERDGLLNTLDSELPYDSSWEDSYDDCWNDMKPAHEPEQEFTEYTAYQPSLKESLNQQLDQISIGDDLRTAAQIIIDELDADGYCRTELKQLAHSYALNVALLEHALQVVQGFSPSGIAARNLEECLRLQTEALPLDTPYRDVLLRIFQRNFFHIDKNPELIQKRLDLNDEDFNGALSLLKSLQPFPADRSSERDSHIEADLILREKHGIYYAQLLQDPSDAIGLRINRSYARMVNSYTGDDRLFMRAQLQEAQWFISAIEKRNDTVLRIANAIIAYQQDYFATGAHAMRPLSMNQIAEMVDMNQSTVSRSVNGKYLLTPHGIIELRQFFSTQIDSDTHDDPSAIAVKAIIKDLIAAEDSSKPLSDNAIGQRLSEQGIHIARRTISKYREELGISSSSQRRRQL